MKKGLLKVAVVVVAYFILFLSIFGVKVIPLILKTFPIENAEAVIFTLTHSVEGANDYIFFLVNDALKSSLFDVVFITIAIVSIVVCVLFVGKKLHKHIAKGFIFIGILLFVSFVCLCNFGYHFVTDLPLREYKDLYGSALATPAHSEFYQNEYVFPDSVNLKFPENKKNLLLIFLESMEYEFQDSVNGGYLKENLIPEISDYMRENIAFIPGGDIVYGTGWTMGDVVAKTCGLPLIYPPGISGNKGGIQYLLPKATCLTDILLNQGYDVTISKGANMNFGSMAFFLKSHGNPNAHDLCYYSQNGDLVQDSVSSWGVYDSKHYELIKMKLDALAKSSQPWALWMFTVDTHTPYGNLDQKCDIPNGVDEVHQYPYIISCSSRILSNFIQWAKRQDWFENTVIAVMGDHRSHADYTTIGYESPNVSRHWLNFFINSEEKAESYNRVFSSFDMYPTILESMGVEIPNHALALGRSLFSKEPTLIEQYGLDSLNKMLKPRNFEYDYFLYSK